MHMIKVDRVELQMLTGTDELFKHGSLCLDGWMDGWVYFSNIRSVSNSTGQIKNNCSKTNERHRSGKFT